MGRRRIRSWKSEAGGRIPRPNYSEVLARTDPAGPKAVREVGAYLPIQSAVFRRPAEVVPLGVIGVDPRRST